MSEDEQRIIIAELDGYKNVRFPTPEEEEDVCLRSPGAAIPLLVGIHCSDRVWLSTIPDYLIDLNAIKSVVVRKLAPEEWDEFWFQLSDITQSGEYTKWGVYYIANKRDFLAASAAQWCEAFLKTIKKIN